MGKKVNDIISLEWFNYMNHLSGYDKVINYSWKKSTISKLERKEIKATLQEIDDLTGISFVKTKKKNDDLRFIHTKKIDGLTGSELDHNHNLIDDAVVGRASALKNNIKIFIKDDDDTVSLLEKYVLRHEVSHALGLKHPHDHGPHPDFTVSDTVMSYNVFENYGDVRFFKYYGFTDLDKQALKTLWGLNPESFFVDSVIIPQDIVEIL